MTRGPPPVKAGGVTMTGAGRAARGARATGAGGGAVYSVTATGGLATGGLATGALAMAELASGVLASEGIVSAAMASRLANWRTGASIDTDISSCRGLFSGGATSSGLYSGGTISSGLISGAGTGTGSTAGFSVNSRACLISSGATSSRVMMTRAPILVVPHSRSAKLSGSRMQPCEAA